MLGSLLLLFSLFSVHNSLDLVVPAYFSTDSDGLKEWNRLISTASSVPLTVIINPEEFQDTRLQEIVKSLRARGATVIGWIDGNMRRELAHIYEDVDYYLMNYSNLDGVFLDQMEDENSQLVFSYYRQIYDYVKAKNERLQIIANPGIPVSENFLLNRLTDRFVTFEGAQADYGLYYQQNWTQNYPRSQFIHFIYGATVTQALEDLKRLEKQRIGGIFVTNGIQPYPYEQLPPFWRELVDTVEKMQ